MVGYIVTTWRRLSQTFVLTEVLALERSGVPLRIFSVTPPSGEPIHVDVARVRARVSYLSFRRRWRSVIYTYYRLARQRPRHYFRCLSRPAGYSRCGVIEHLLRAEYLAELLPADAVR